MKLHDLKPAPGSQKRRIRVGRGIAAGRGKTAGRGTKGQKSRSGASIPGWFEGGQTPIHVRVPKLRGFKPVNRIDYQVVNVGRISEYAAAGRFGEVGKGAQRWLDLGVIRFQPSEILKLVVPITVAWYLAPRILPPRFKYIAASLVIIAIPAALILRQPDLGTALLIAASGLFVVFMAGIGWRYLFGAVVLAIASAWPAWMFLLM